MKVIRHTFLSEPYWEYLKKDKKVAAQRKHLDHLNGLLVLFLAGTLIAIGWLLNSFEGFYLTTVTGICCLLVMVACLPLVLSIGAFVFVTPFFFPMMLALGTSQRQRQRAPITKQAKHENRLMIFKKAA